MEWGLDHPLWQARVLGQFPTQSDDALYSLAWLEAARYHEGGDGPIHAGIDVAEGGEAETVVCVRAGNRILEIAAFADRDPRGKVAATLMLYKGRLENVNVDSVAVGAHFTTHMRDLGFPVTGINAGSRSSDPEKFFNLKGEMYWGFRLLLESGAVAGLVDEKTISQLASVRYSHTSRGQIVIEKKDDARKRGVKSPDRAEAVILAFAGDVGKPQAGFQFFWEPGPGDYRRYAGMLSRQW